MFLLYPSNSLELSKRNGIQPRPRRLVPQFLHPPVADYGTGVKPEVYCIKFPLWISSIILHYIVKQSNIYYIKSNQPRNHRSFLNAYRMRKEKLLWLNIFHVSSELISLSFIYFHSILGKLIWPRPSNNYLFWLWFCKPNFRKLYDLISQIIFDEIWKISKFEPTFTLTMMIYDLVI